MAAKTEHSYPNQDIIFYNSRGLKIEGKLKELTFDFETPRHELVECQLTVEVTSEVYKQVENEGDFNFSLSGQGTNFKGGFDLHKPIELELGLRATLLAELAACNGQPEEAAKYLLELDSSAALRQSGNWYLLRVKQNEGLYKAGYQTKWVGVDSPVRLQQIEPRELYQGMLTFFEADGWEVIPTANPNRVQVDYEGENAGWRCYAEVVEDNDQFSFYSIFPQLAPENKRIQVAELLCRINYELVLGNFEMDFEDGEIRCRTSIILENPDILILVIKHLVYANVSVMDQYAPVLATLLTEVITPQEALELVFPEDWAEASKNLE